jgi:hypothetical protein
MRRLFSLTVAGLLLCGGLVRASDKPDSSLLKDAKEHSCGSFGTKVEFVDTPSEAAKIAKKQEKLVFVLHVSGNFEDPRFT